MTIATRLLEVGRPTLAPNLAGTLALWFKADALGLANNAAVSSWTDSSGNARHAVQATGGKQPLFKTAILNGQPVVRFDGTDDDLLTGTFTALAQPNTIVSVAKPVVVTNNGNIVDSLSGSRNLVGDRGNYGTYAGGAAVVFSSFAVTTAPVVVTAIFDGAASICRVNGTDSGTDNGGAQAPTRFALGSTGAENGEWWNGDIAEVCIYNARLAAAPLQQLERFLGVKYGIPVV